MSPRDARYARQISVRGVGEVGQAAFERATVEVAGSGLDAELCALYLCGAGVGRLTVDPSLAGPCRALNAAVAVEERDGGAALGVWVELDGVRLELPSAVLAPSGAVARGAAAARWALASILARLHAPVG
ncbi:hypothetical protein L6R52_13470 [Myxococcota bacterium]|nr:hypothetical protein [Myxococcota bacterium]